MFSAGDYVECIDDSGLSLPGQFTKGKIYKVSRYAPLSSHHPTGHLLIEKDDSGNVNGWAPQRFKLHLPVGQVTLPRQIDMQAIKEAFSGYFIVPAESQLHPLECDCGSLKTYKTMSPEAHSTWCKINTKVLA